jgi:hypothetical protein
MVEDEKEKKRERERVAGNELKFIRLLLNES